MSIRLYQTECPNCRSKGKDKHKDNLAVYDDGHTYCFSCGTYTPGNIISKINKQKQNKYIKNIPEDITKTIKKEAYDWIHKYLDTVPKNFYYSEQEQSLIIILDNSGVWIARYFGTEDKPKWLAYGIGNHTYHIEGITNTNKIVIVEDIISATKVGHITPTLCLFGSIISTEKIAKLLLLGYNEIILWLDPDKHEYMLKRKKELDLICNCKIILSDKDPKEYNYEKINELLISD